MPPYSFGTKGIQRPWARAFFRSSSMVFLKLALSLIFSWAGMHSSCTHWRTFSRMALASAGISKSIDMAGASLRVLRIPNPATPPWGQASANAALGVQRRLGGFHLLADPVMARRHHHALDGADVAAQPVADLLRHVRAAGDVAGDLVDGEGGVQGEPVAVLVG